MTTAEYDREHPKMIIFSQGTRWSEPKFNCPECHKFKMLQDKFSYEKETHFYTYQCGACGYILRRTEA